MDEFQLIARLRAANPVHRSDVALGIGDDAALVHSKDEQLVLAMDTLVGGVHFPRDTAPEDIGYKALAVNLSDLAAMGATPRWALLSLTLPEAEQRWCDGFASGFFSLAAEHQVALVGGDTCRGPLSISVTVAGAVTQAVRRAGAKSGDQIVATGWLGDAAAGLALLQGRLKGGDCAPTDLLARLRRPTPRLRAGQLLAAHAHAMIDVSDGLLADLGHVLHASDVGAVVHGEKLPFSPALAAAVPRDTQRWSLQLSGGDDYELLACIPADRLPQVAACASVCGHPFTVIGEIRAQGGLEVLAHGRPLNTNDAGFRHF